jgi:hypothetical protein
MLLLISYSILIFCAMKKILFLLAICGIWLGGCQKETANPESTSDTGIETVVASVARMAVASDSVTVKNCKGRLKEINSTDLAAAVTSYISEQYAGASVKFAAQDDSGKVVVAIVLADGTVKGLLFNADSTFSRELKQHTPKAKLTKIEAAALPATVTSYITTNFAGATVKEAATNADGSYFVAITIGDAVKVLVFNADGTFSKELEKPAGKHKRH